MKRYAFAVTLLASLALASVGTALGQEGMDASEHQAKMEEHEVQMRAHMEQMEEARARLDALVAEMTSSTGEARVEAISAVVAELAAQHQMMHEHMRSMMGHGMMGRCMMGHGEEHDRGEGHEDHEQEHGEKDPSSTTGRSACWETSDARRSSIASATSPRSARSSEPPHAYASSDPGGHHRQRSKDGG